jgi:probable HAF family extracellular repeat protein
LFRPAVEPVEDRCLLSGYTITDLGTQFPRAINNHGQVVGFGPSGSFLRDSNGVVTTIDPNGDAFDLNNPDASGNVQVVGETGSGQDLFLWDQSTGEHVSSISVSTLFGNKPVSISNSGVVVGDYLTSTGKTHAFVWKDQNGDGVVQSGEFQDLHNLLTTDSSGASIATAVIDATSAVPHLQVVANATVAGRGWQSSFVLTDLNDDGDFLDAGEKTALASKGGETQAFTINDVGQVAGYTGGNAVIWQNGAITKKLGQFNKGTPIPTGINHGGQVVGWGGGASGQDVRAWVWTGSGSIQDLNSLLPGGSGWTKLENAWGINDAGMIVGQGQLTAGVEHGFLLTPTSAPSSATSTALPSFADAKTSSPAPPDSSMILDLVYLLPGGSIGENRKTTKLSLSRNASSAWSPRS